MTLLVNWLKHTPNDDWARSQLSALALSQGDETTAISVLESAPNLSSQPVFMNNLANNYLNNYVKSVFSTVLSNKETVTVSTAEKLEKNSMLEQAITYALQAYKLAPNIAAIADGNGRTPDATSPITAVVVKDEDCQRTVHTIAPKNIQ